MNLRAVSIAVVVCWAGVAAAAAAELGNAWTVASGDWNLTREIVPLFHQRQTEGQAAAFHRGDRGDGNAWRTYVKLSQGTGEAGLWLRDSRHEDRGLLALVGRHSPVGGFLVRSQDGAVVWEDKYAPWQPYHFYVVELVVEAGQVRAQMFEGDQETLVSQSPWIPLDVPSAKDLDLGLFARDGVARFLAPQRAAQPLSPIVADPPNLRRLIADEASPWLVDGPGNWMWTTSSHERLRQTIDVERTWAFHRGIRGNHRQWECRLRVDPGAKGAGILFQTNPERTQGFIAWLGGKYGAGSLMLYQYQPESRACWSGKSDSWHYDTDYVLRGETRPGQARVQLLEADGTTVISDSSWIDVGEEHAAKEGCLGFHVWGGRAEFWGFSESTRTDPTVDRPAAETTVDLGHGWQALGGQWRWTDAARERLAQQSNSPDAMALNPGLQGIQGTWRCRLRLDNRTAAGLMFQAGRDGKEGFVGLVAPQQARLETLQGKTLWEQSDNLITLGQDYVLEGIVTTDRIAFRVLAADGTTEIVASPDVYVSESNNTRTGCLGLTTRGAPAAFWGWELLASGLSETSLFMPHALPRCISPMLRVTMHESKVRHSGHCTTFVLSLQLENGAGYALQAVSTPFRGSLNDATQRSSDDSSNSHCAPKTHGRKRDARDITVRRFRRPAARRPVERDPASDCPRDADGRRVGSR